MKTKNIKRWYAQIMYRLATGVLLIIPISISAQQLSPEVVCSGGGSVAINSVYLDYSIGQIVDELLTSSGTILTQGFLQGSVINTAISEDFQYETKLKVYPVPAENSVFIENNTNETECSFVMRDMQSRIVKKGNFKHKVAEVDISNLNSGIYFLSLYFNEHQPVSKKIIKQ